MTQNEILKIITEDTDKIKTTKALEELKKVLVDKKVIPEKTPPVHN